MKERDRLLMCEEKNRDGFQLITMHLSEPAEDVLPLAMWKDLFLCPLSGFEQEQLNTSARLSSL